jgi:hypothetical protein
LRASTRAPGRQTEIPRAQKAPNRPLCTKRLSPPALASFHPGAQSVPIGLPPSV